MDRCHDVPKHDTFFPTRLLDLDAWKDSEDIILIDVAQQQQQQKQQKQQDQQEKERNFAQYAALSHCWGPEPHPDNMKTTLANQDLKEKRIGFSDIPKNFQWAVTVARRLGLRYIWIDALCIIQDSKSDWNHEAAQMGKVYSNATLTICSMSTNVRDPGFFIPIHDMDSCSEYSQYFGKTVDGTLQRPFTWRPPLQYEWYELFRSNPLTSRAWCFQEWQLSSRLLIPTPFGLLWQCKSSVILEKHPVTRMLNQASYPSLNLNDPSLCYWSADTSTINLLHNPILRLVDYRPSILFMGDDFKTIQTIIWTVQDREQEGKVAPIYDLWCMILEEYTARKLTVEVDKFPALSGVAERIAQLTGDEYIAGLWKGDFARGLLWGSRPITKFRVENEKVEQPGVSWTRPKKKIAPSWSWASVVGPISMPTILHNIEAEFEALARVSHSRPFWSRVSGIEVELEDLENPFGCISDGSAVLKIGAYYRTAKIGSFHPSSTCRWITSFHDGVNEPCQTEENTSPGSENVVFLDIPSEQPPEQNYLS